MGSLYTADDRDEWLEARREALEGVDADDAARWLAPAGRERLPKPPKDWRKKRPTGAQAKLLRALGDNPNAYRTRGAASDAIQRAKRERVRG